MIEHISIRNFRKFTEFKLSLRHGNIIVGPNNAGKSSILDALRILDACLRHARAGHPKLLDIEREGVFPGYELPPSAIPCGMDNITNNHSENDAIITYRHQNKNRLTVRLHPEHQIKFYINSPRTLQNGTKFRDAFPVDLVIVPTLAPLEGEEKYVEDRALQS